MRNSGEYFRRFRTDFEGANFRNLVTNVIFGRQCHNGHYQLSSKKQKNLKIVIQIPNVSNNINTHNRKA